MALSVLLGGPAYQHLVDARHAGSIGSLAIHFRERGHAPGFGWQHACPVELARNELMRVALSGPTDVVVSMDADCFVQPGHENGIVWVAEELDKRDQPLCAIPVPQRDGTCNIADRIAPDGQWVRKRITVGEQTMERCLAAGTGCMVFWLPWYRKHWPDAPWFRTDWTERPDGTPQMISEDFWHCREVAARGRDPMYAPVALVHHATRGILK